MSLIVFLCLVTWSCDSNTMLNNSRDGRLVTFLASVGMLLLGFRYRFFFIIIRIYSFIPIFLSVFIRMEFCQRFFIKTMKIFMIFSPETYYVVNHINRFSNIESSLHSWYKSHLVMAYCLLTVVIESFH